MRKIFVSLLAVIAALALAQSSMAFSDIGESPLQMKIRALKDAGVVRGEAEGVFNPHGKLNYASGVTIIVKGLDLSLAKFLFIKEPKAADFYTNVADGTWYSEAFVIAQVNGLDIPADVDPERIMTREQFAYHLFRAIEATGEYAYILPYILIEDEAEVDPGYMSAIQTLLIANIVSLDEKGRFNSKAEITRAEAAEWIYNARDFVRRMAEMENQPPVPDAGPFYDFSLDIQPVNENVNAVTVSAEAPHPGYGIRITRIEFIGNDAVIHTEAVWPDPDGIYPQVITRVSAVTYIGAEYKPVLAKDYDEVPLQKPDAGLPLPVDILPAPGAGDENAASDSAVGDTGSVTGNSENERGNSASGGQ